MKILIIEDERLTAKDLEDTILQYDSGIVIVAKLLSVKEAVRYFQENEEPDLIFSDIQLGDGLSFEIFKTTKVNAPIIFCTAYDEYALAAFHTNGIDYLLKPFTITSVTAALNKFERLTQLSKKKDAVQLETIMKLIENKQADYQSSLLVPYKEKIIPFRFQDIAVFYLENEVVNMITFDQKKYFPNKTLEDLESLSGKNFYRANRQYLINRKVVIDVSNQLGRKLWVNVSIPLKDSITISREKMPHFLKWLSGE